MSQTTLERSTLETDGEFRSSYLRLWRRQFTSGSEAELRIPYVDQDSVEKDAILTIPVQNIECINNDSYKTALSIEDASKIYLGEASTRRLELVANLGDMVIVVSSENDRASYFIEQVPLQLIALGHFAIEAPDQQPLAA